LFQRVELELSLDFVSGWNLCLNGAEKEGRTRCSASPKDSEQEEEIDQLISDLEADIKDENQFFGVQAISSAEETHQQTMLGTKEEKSNSSDQAVAVDVVAVVAMVDMVVVAAVKAHPMLNGPSLQ
jgi:hypothetical protein